MEIFLIAVLGGVLALDTTSVGQFMVSRPLVVGVLAGLVVGQPVLGATIGAILELYLLVSFPTGGSRFPEGATATVVAVASSAGASGSGVLPLAIGLGLVWGQLGGASVTLLRHTNSKIVEERTNGLNGVVWVVKRHLGAVTLDFCRGSLVTTLGVVLGRFGLPALSGSWPLGVPSSIGLLLVGGSVSAGIFLRDLGGFRQRRTLFAVGIALGIIGARLL